MASLGLEVGGAQTQTTFWDGTMGIEGLAVFSGS